MVDEYQDTNHAQFRLVSILGREAHATWPWSATRTSRSTPSAGADIRNISEFEQDFPDAYVIALEQNYRSTQTILDAANAVIAHNRDRKPKQPVVGSRQPATRCGWSRPRTSTRRPGSSPAASRRRWTSGCRPGRHRRLLPDERPVPGAGGPADPPGRRLPGDRRPEVLRAGRDQGRDRLPAGARQPGRRGLAAADREPAPAGDRQHDARPAGDARRGPHGPVAVGGDRAGRRRPGWRPPPPAAWLVSAT